MKKQNSLFAWLVNTSPMLLLALFVLLTPMNSWGETVDVTWDGTSGNEHPSGTTDNPASNTKSGITVTTNWSTSSGLCVRSGCDNGNVFNFETAPSGNYIDITTDGKVLTKVYVSIAHGGGNIQDVYIAFSSSATYDGNDITSPIALSVYNGYTSTTEACEVIAPSGAKSARIHREVSGWGPYLHRIRVIAQDGCASPETATFSRGDATSGSVNNIEACEGSSFTMPSEGTMMYPGYLFAGWKLNNAGDPIAAGTSYTMPAGGASFTAAWTEDNTSLRIPGSCTELNANNRSALTGSVGTNYDVDKDGNNDTYLNILNGHAEWNVIITPGTYDISVVCCVPYWGIEITISLIDPAGIESPIQLYKFRNSGAGSSTPTDGSGTASNVDLSSLTLNKRYTVKAEDTWTGSTVYLKNIAFTQLGANRPITFAKGDESVTGSVPADASCAVGGSYTLPGIGTLARVGYSFAGWSDGTNTYAVGDSYTMPDEDVTFTAQWNPMVVPNVTGLAMDNPFNSNIPLTWSIPGIGDLSKVMEPFTPNGGAGVGSKDSYTYHYNDGEEYDYVDAQGDSPKWGQYGIGFPITPTTGIEWLSFDYKGEHADMSFWGALYNQNNTAEVYNDFGNDKALNDDENWQESGELHPNKYYWNHDFSGAITDKEITHVAIYVNSGDYGGYDDVQVSIRNVRYHIANQADIDHVVLMRKAGSAATGIDDAGATQLFSGIKSKYTDSEEKTIGTTYYYTVFSVHADGTVSSGATISKTITNDTPHNVTYAKGDENVTGDVPTDAENYVEGGNVTLAAIGDLAWDNHVFIGWSDGTDIYAVGASYTMPDADVTFTAQWRDLEAPIIIPSEETHLDANNYHDIPGGTYSMDVDGTGASTCIDIAGNKYAEWIAKFTSAHYKATLTYGTTGYTVDVILKIYDGETEVKATAVDHHSDGSGVHTYQRTWGLDLTDLDPDKVYKVRVIDAYSDASSNPKVGYLDFEIVVPTDISNTASTRLDYTNVSVDPGTVEFDIKNNGNSVTCLDIKDHGQADWYVYITPDVYDINMLYGTPEYSTNVTFSIIDPATGSTVFAPAAMTHSGAASTPWYEDKTWNNVDLSGLDANKQYIVRVVDTYSSTGSKPKVQYITFSKHEVIQIGAFETVLNKDNTISTVSTVTDIDIDGDGNNDACMNLRNTYAEWEVNITRGVYTMMLEYGVSTSSGSALKVQIDLIDPSGVEATRRLLYHYITNDVEGGLSMSKIATRGCDFSEVTEGKRYIIRVSDVYGDDGCKLRVRNLSFEPFSPVQIPTTPRLNASNVFTQDVFAYNNFDADGDDANDECLYIRNHATQGVSPAEWKVNITPGIYKMNVVYGAPSGNSYDITVSLVDPEVGGEGTQLYTKHVSGSASIVRQNETVSDIDWTNLTAGKEYIIRVASVNGSTTGNKLYFGSMSFERKQEHTRSGLRVGDFGTVCIGYAVAAADIEGAEMYEIDQWSADGRTLELTALTNSDDMVAGRPYIFRATASTMTLRYDGTAAEASAGSYNGLIGSYSQALITANDGNYIIYNNKLYFVDSEAYVGANRAYIHKTSATTPSPVQRKRVTLAVEGGQVATGMDGVQNAEYKVRKVLIDGMLLILRDGKVYNAQGIEIQ